MLALIEVSLVFFANFTLENAVDQTSRMIRTGQAQEQGFSEAQFKQTVCDKVSVIPDCMAGLKLDVRKFDDFGGINLPDPLDGDGELLNNFGFDIGVGGNVVVVRAFYEWDLIANFPGGLGNMPNGSRLLVATAAFRNEPFDD
jgi:Flp pilus assembly protein TadG